MATAVQPISALLTMEEYLQTIYRPDCDFVDGYLEERNVGGTKHGLIQQRIGIWFAAHWEDWNLLTISEQRTKVTSSRVRLPDVAVVPDDDSFLEEPRVTPPFIAIEILSPDDRLPRVILRLKDFEAMGVQHIWLIDPVERVAYTFYKGLSVVEGHLITIQDSPVHLDLAQLFTWLDKRSERRAQ